MYTQNVEEPFIRNDHSCKQQAEAEFFANPDSTYLIRWRGIYIDNDYEWRCSESSADQGSHYTMPLDLKLGLDSVVVPIGEERWF